MKIFKYAVPVDDKWAQLDLPLGSEVVHVAVQGNALGTVWLWILLNPDNEYREARFFRVFGTGHDLGPHDCKYVGTCLWDGGRLVWHVMEKRR
jgi:hypothetical protein